MSREIISAHFDGGAEALPALIDRAALALTSARSSAEVLEARDMARVAYDAAKIAGRMARAKEAHDEVIAAVYRAQADAAVIEARAKIRLADEYDAAQERGEVAKLGDNLPSVGVHNSSKPATAADLGLRRDEIHEARKLRDAEKKEPGKIKAAADALVERGEEPTKAALRREVVGEAKATEDQPKEDEPESDPEAAKQRRALAKLTHDALIDEVIGLRAENAELRDKAKAMKAEVEDLKSRLGELSSDDRGAVITALNKKLKHAENEKWRQTEETGRAMKQVYALKKRVAELESIGIPLNR